LAVGTPKAAPPGVLRPEPPEGIRAGRGAVPAPSSGRWRRGVALPPTEDGARRKDRDADNPNELWDDPIGGSGGAATDFSAFGGILDDSNDPGADDAFDFEKMAEASRKLEEEMHGSRSEMDNGEDDDEDDELRHTVKVDPKRPLATLGTTISSGSGDDVNVFEDFDSPSEPENDAPAIRSGDADPNASSRLMKMIGVNKDAPPSDSAAGEPSNLWGASTAPDGISSVSEQSPSGDPIIGGIGGLSSIPSNPWGDPMMQTAVSDDPAVGGMDLAARLGALAVEQKTRDVLVEQRAQEAEIRRRQEEESQRRGLAQRQAEEQAYQQRAQAAAMQQQQAQNQQSQVELVLMERICAILENSWGRSDLISILTTLHSEDSRVIPLLSNVDALTALIARSPQRIALRRDPNFSGDMAVLVLTNAQWQQQQVARSRARQEELHRREQQRRIEEEAAAARARSEAQHRAVASIVPDAPWFYSDPQNNIQVGHAASCADFFWLCL
jgi:sRNA-binding protein